MGTFFHGWRRKIGVVTLLLALVCMGGWIRSSLVADQLLFAKGAHSTGYLGSLNGYLMCSQVDEQQANSPPSYPVWERHPAQMVKEVLFDQIPIEWSWYGFGAAEFRNKDGSVAKMWFMPYWSIVIPLTMLSAYLLLSKPRAAKPLMAQQQIF